MQAQLIENKIKNAITDAEVTLESADGIHYSATVISAEFAGKSRLEQHRMVMNALSDVIASDEVHALALKTLVRE
ncbi:BolA/IbaG family iron-sulfur metabolism protein [Rappaport israeli]|uniref:BolA/IbaG family iron-sulfur metabolism protein n=1 Tax=Rappaport israeli TaxID=1839807 RepID=UPI000930D855|nr:BolA/IbaG family iron-sulfur metabolism protein [Rappaport israeli]